MRQLPNNWRELPKPAERTCNGCRQTSPFTEEFFPIHRRYPWGLNPRCRKCYNKAARVYNKKAQDKFRLECLSAYGVGGKPVCQCCSESRLEFLALDHINGGGTQERKKHGNSQQLLRHLVRGGFPAGYRTLCHNCNMSFGLYGYCPHAQEGAAHAATV